MTAQEFKDLLQIALQLANMIIIGYGFYKFLNKPHDTLEEKHEELKKRVDKHDVELEDIKESMHLGNDKFRDYDEEFVCVWDVMLAFVDFEIAYCQSTGYTQKEDLVRAKQTLEKFLARGRRKRHERESGD